MSDFLYVAAADGSDEDDLSSNPVILLLTVPSEAWDKISEMGEKLEPDFQYAVPKHLPDGIHAGYIDLNSGNNWDEYGYLFDYLSYQGDMGTGFLCDGTDQELAFDNLWGEITEYAEPKLTVFSGSTGVCFFLTGDWELGSIDIDPENHHVLPKWPKEEEE